MSIELTFEGDDKEIISTKQKRLDWDRINYFASLTPDEVSKEAFRLTTCPSIYCLPGHKGCPTAKKVSNPDKVVIVADQVPEGDKSIPPIDETHSLDNFTPMPSTTTDSIPYPTSYRRSFRQRRDIQLRPYTVDRMKHQSLLYGKRSSTPSGTAANRTTLTPISKLPSHLSSTQDSLMPDDQSYMESLSSDSDDDFIDGLDFENLDTLVDMDRASQLSGNAQRGNNDMPDTANDSEDNDTDAQPYRKKRRRFRIIDDDDDDDDDDDGGVTTTAAPVDQINTTNNDKTSDIDIFAFPYYDTPPPSTTYHQKKSPNKLITYKRSNQKKRSPHRHYPTHKTANTTNADKSLVGRDIDKGAVCSTSHLAKDVFDFETFGELGHRGGNSKEGDIDMDTATSLYISMSMDTDNDASRPGSTQTTTSQKAPSTRQKRHNAANLGRGGGQDDSGFVVEEGDGHEERRRNTTLHEVRKYKRTLKGILPHSFVKVFQQQLDHEEHHVQRRPRPRPAHPPPDSGVTVDNNNSKSGQPSTDDVFDIWDIGDDEVCPTAPNSAAPADQQRTTLSDQTLEQALKHQQQQEQKHQEQEELMQRQKRHLAHDSFTVDFGLPALRHGALCGKRLNYLETKAFAAFSVSHQSSSWDNIFDQRFCAEDYFVGSPKIVSLFHLAFQQFYVMWHTPDCIDTTSNIDLRKVFRASPLLGFLRFVSGCLSKCDGGDVVSMEEMKQFLVCQMDAFVDRVLAIVHWTDATKMDLPGNMDHYTTLPLLLVLFYCVEWSFQLRRFPTVISHWSMETTLRRLLWYLLSLGPLSVLVVSMGTYEFSIANPFVAEAWILLLQLFEIESPGDTFLWKCLQDFMKTMAISTSQEVYGNGTTMTVWQKNELTWQWIMTIMLLQRLQKNEDRLVIVGKSTERMAKTRCFELLSQVLNDISQQKVHTSKPAAIGSSSNTPTISNSQPIDRFYAMTAIRLTFVRYHLLMVKYRWMWDNKTIQQLFSLAQSQTLQTFTGDPHQSTQSRYQATDTATQYFPLYFTNYNGTIPDDQMDDTDSCGTLFMKILSLGLWRTVDQILELRAQGDHEGSTRHRDQLKKCLVRLSPSYLVVSGSSTGSDSQMLTAMVSASSHNNIRQPDPFVTFAYYYLINMAILHATARLGKEDNTGLKVLESNIVLQSKVETEKAWAKDITRLVSQIYGSIKDKWHLT